MITQLNSFGVTDIGCRRAENEDQYLLSGLNQPVVANTSHPSDSDSLVANRTMLLAVADGLGGHQGGAIASEMAVESLGCFAQENEPRINHAEAAWKLANLLRKGILKANERIGSLASQHATKSGMATTLTAALIRYPDLIIGHVGDSRCYLFRDGELDRLTTDHTFAELHRHQGQVADLAEGKFSMEHVLWNCLGGEAKTDVESRMISLEPGDWVILATDGLSKHVSDQEIRCKLAVADSPRQLCTELKQMAIDRGGQDNITIVACRT